MRPNLAKFFWGQAPKFLNQDYKKEHASDYVAKFRGDRATEI